MATVDVERLLSNWLVARPDIQAIVGDRVVTVMPNRAQFPLLLLTLIGGAPITSQPLYLDRSYIQFDCYGGPKAQARLLLDTVRWAVDTEFPGLHPAGVITGVEWAEARYLPDSGYETPQPRFIASVFIYSHP